MQNELMNIDPLTGMPVEYTMTPPMPANQLGTARLNKLTLREFLEM